jgi:hypothetical protein
MIPTNDPQNGPPNGAPRGGATNSSSAGAGVAVPPKRGKGDKGGTRDDGKRRAGGRAATGTVPGVPPTTPQWPAAKSVAAKSVAAKSVAAKPGVPKKVVCPVSGTIFNARTTGGRCPVCGEQVVPREALARAVPGVSSATTWLAGGGWRLVALIALIVYQLIAFGLLWHHMIDIHAL